MNDNIKISNEHKAIVELEEQISNILISADMEINKLLERYFIERDYIDADATINGDVICTIMMRDIIAEMSDEPSKKIMDDLIAASDSVHSWARSTSKRKK